jgi:hypothetical protein
VKFVNNATNVTRTSTIHVSDFVLPSTAAKYFSAVVVSELVITTEMGGIEYKLYASALIELMYRFRDNLFFF